MIRYLLRHGETVWNTQGRKQGRKDSPLTLKGIKQAKKVSKKLKKELKGLEGNYNVVISPQWRAIQCAGIFCEVNRLDFNSCIIEDGLREHCFGLWEGLTEDQINDEFPGFLEDRYKKENHWKYIVPMGESYELLHKRVFTMLDFYDGALGRENIVFICHEMVCKVIKGIYEQLSSHEILALTHKNDQIERFYL